MSKQKINHWNSSLYFLNQDEQIVAHQLSIELPVRALGVPVVYNDDTDWDTTNYVLRKLFFNNKKHCEDVTVINNHISVVSLLKAATKLIVNNSNEFIGGEVTHPYIERIEWSEKDKAFELILGS